MTTLDARGLKIERALHDFLVSEALPGSGVDEASFFAGLADLVAEFAPRNRALLERRDELQAKLDDYYREHRAKPFDQAHYMSFLREIGYLLPQPAPRAVTTANVDPEIADIAGPQLVVPISNARYALNAANARWGSLYDALLRHRRDHRGPRRHQERRLQPGARRPRRRRGQGRSRHDRRRWPAGSHASVAGYRVENRRLVVTMIGGAETGLAYADRFDGYHVGTPSDPSLVLLLPTTASMSRSSSTARIRSAAPIRPASPT